MKTGGLYAVDAIVGNLRYVPGTGAVGYVQGSPESEACRQEGESQFTHVLGRDMAVMETEVTRQMWADLRAAQPGLPKEPTHPVHGEGMGNPVQSVTWYEAVLFANLLSAEEGLRPCYYTGSDRRKPITSKNYKSSKDPYCDFTANGYRLATEGEWEYFCRAGAKGPFTMSEPNYGAGNCGVESEAGMYPGLEKAAWFWANSSAVESTSPAGTKDANAWNLKDTHGNVWEWCWDWYAGYPAGSAGDYTGPASGTVRVLRGAGWRGNADACRSARRGRNTQKLRNHDVGFRLVRTLGGWLYGVDPIVGNLRFVPATGPGGFQQGSWSGEACRDDEEGPQHTHVLTRGIAVMEMEVTRMMWAYLRAVQASLPVDPTNTDFGSGMKNPVQNVTWYEAMLFANLLSVQQGLPVCYYTNRSKTQPITSQNYVTDTAYCDLSVGGYRLPTEGEWEYSCRAGTAGPFSIEEPAYNGNTCWDCEVRLPKLSRVAWWCGSSEDSTHAAGKKKSNPWNLKDVHGNVWEWCWDWWGDYPAGTVTDDAGPAGGSQRVLRGGSFNYYAQLCRSAHRINYSPGYRWYGYGFRLVRSVP